MLERGAVTFWEEYDPNVPKEEQYDMYGDKLGEPVPCLVGQPDLSACQVFCGLRITDPLTGAYEIEPHLEEFDKLRCVLPVRDKQVHIQWDRENGLAVSAEEYVENL